MLLLCNSAVCAEFGIETAEFLTYETLRYPPTICHAQ